MNILLHVRVPGPPTAQERVRFNAVQAGNRIIHRFYDPCSKAKENFLWLVKACKPKLEPAPQGSRIGVRLRIWTNSMVEDADNYAKFYMDALSPKVVKKKKRLPHGILIPEPPPFSPWRNDNQVDRLEVDVQRQTGEPEHVDILIYVLERNNAGTADQHHSESAN